jgi:hypothetical protein
LLLCLSSTAFLQPGFPDRRHKSFKRFRLNLHLVILNEEISDLLLSQVTDVFDSLNHGGYLAKFEDGHKLLQFVFH